MTQSGAITSAIVPGINGMPKVLLVHPSGSAAEIYLNGAHVTSWKPADAGEQLFLSKAAVFEPGKPIRGGIPVVFPQFADSGPLPKHGWLRTSQWTVEPATEPSVVRLRTRDDANSRALWPHSYAAELCVALDALNIEVTLTIINTGGEPFSFTCALHSYLAVTDASQASILGLYRSPYIDKTAGGALIVDDEQALRLRDETDRIYTGAPWRLELVDGISRLDVSTTGFPDAVIWNPWAVVANGIADMLRDDYLRFICVESAVANTPATLPPGDSWTGCQRLAVMR